MNCVTCKKSIKNIFKARKYCSAKCRNKEYTQRYKEYRSKFQRDRYDAYASIPSKNKIKCLICGKYYTQVGSHAYNSHRITAREYRELNGLDVKRGILPTKLRKLKASQCRENGTINNLKNGKRYRYVKGDKKAGKYTRSKQTLERLSKLHTLRKL